MRVARQSNYPIGFEFGCWHPRWYQRLVSRGACGWGLEFTAFFQGRGYCSAVLLGGLLGDGERRVLHGGLPGFLEIPVARAVGVELARKSGAEFYFPG